MLIVRICRVRGVCIWIEKGVNREIRVQRRALGPDLCFLVSGSGDLHVYLEAGHRVNRLDEDVCRLSLFLQTEGSVFEVLKGLKEAGVELLDDVPEEVGENTYTFRFRDPDGNILEAIGGGCEKGG